MKKNIFIILLGVFSLVAQAMDRPTRPEPDDCEHNRGAKKARWIAQDEIKK